MNKKMSKRQRDIKTKLMAAVCMLLVSSIMMVSTTYAWFTLSTAPEVTGITTAVGANGNLEMALLNPALQETAGGALMADWGNEIQSGTQDSMDAGKTPAEANITWGNLVDVSDKDVEVYGLKKITLYPSKLSTYVDETDTKLNVNPLERPVYGADGRIAQLKADTLTASFASGKFSNEGALGVRAIGTASSMTAREMEHRDLLNRASKEIVAAKNAAVDALQDNGNVLAAIAITHMGDASKTFTKADMQTLGAVLTALEASFNKIESAMKLYVAAHNIAPATVNDSTYAAIKDAILAMDLATIDAWTNESDYSKPSGFDTAYDELVDVRATVSTTQSTLNAKIETVGDGQYAWADISAVLNNIMEFNSMKICGLTMAQATEKDDAGNYKNIATIATALANGGLTLTMPTGSGVFADIADFTGPYSATITFADGTSVMGYPLGGVPATMSAEPAGTPYLTTMRDASDDFVGANGGESSMSITDFYGYIIDMAFRTNAGGSNLLLQADAIDRIYAGNEANQDTMGGGSTMTFTASDAFGVPKVQDLMTSLRIVFFETDTDIILGYARLNPATATVEGSDVTMKMAMWDTAAKEFKSGEAKVANVITALNQNEAKAVSVLVYLDGETVTNADVATSGTQSMTGTMNLQFASDATLQPMVYTDLKDGTSSVTPDDDELEVETTPIETGVSINEGYTATNVRYATTNKGAKTIAATITKDGVAVTNENATVTIDGVNATFAHGVWAVPTSATEAPTAVAIVVTPKTPATPGTSTTLNNITVTGLDGVTASGSFDAEGNTTITLHNLPDGYRLTDIVVDEIDNFPYNGNGTNTVTFTLNSITADSVVVITVGPIPSNS